MNLTKLITGTIVGAIIVFLLDWLFYGTLMTDMFTSIPDYHREMPDMMWMIIGDLVLMGTFAYMYAKGANSAGTATQQGMRFGVLVGIFVGFGMNLVWYSIQMADPLSAFLIDGVYNIVKYAIAGMLVALAMGMVGGAVVGDRDKGVGGGD